MSQEKKTNVKQLPKPTLMTVKAESFATTYADGYFYSIERDVTTLIFYRDHVEFTSPEIREANVIGRTRELMFEIRLPTSNIYNLSKLIVTSVDDLGNSPEHKDRVGPIKW